MDELRMRLEQLEKQVNQMGTKEKKEKKDKRAPSAYNMFIGDYLKNNKDPTKTHKQLFADATAAWKDKKAPSDKKA